MRPFPVLREVLTLWSTARRAQGVLGQVPRARCSEPMAVSVRVHLRAQVCTTHMHSGLALAIPGAAGILPVGLRRAGIRN